MKKLTKDIMGFTGANIGIGVGTLALDKAGFSTAGMSSMAGLMPTVGTVMMSGHLIRGVKKLGKR